MQALLAVVGIDVDRLHQQLRAEGIETLLHRPQGGASAKLCFVLTTLYRPNEIELAVEAVAENFADHCRSNNLLETSHAYVL